MSEKIIVVGAGVAGLALARELRHLDPLVLEKSRGVGGRCATRRVPGETCVDHGVPMIHGRSAELWRAARSVQGATPLRDWPMHLRGEGTPCQPQAYDSRTRRLAYAEGVAAFPKHLARDLRVSLQTEVQGIALAGGSLALAAGGQSFGAATVVITCPLPQAMALLAPVAEGAPRLAAVLTALGRVHLLPCLTVLAGYDRPTDPGWHLRVPGSTSIVHSLINDSSKRPGAAGQVLVIQGNPVFSRQNLEADPAGWGDALLAEAAELLGRWAAAPAWRQEHRWRFARVQRGDELSNPVLLKLGPDGPTLGLCGEAFSGAGGVEGAYLSGLALAKLMQAGLATPAAGA